MLLPVASLMATVAHPGGLFVSFFDPAPCLMKARFLLGSSLFTARGKGIRAWHLFISGLPSPEFYSNRVCISHCAFPVLRRGLLFGSAITVAAVVGGRKAPARVLDP